MTRRPPFLYYILDGHEPVPATLMEWALFFQRGGKRIVARTEVAPGVNVSTVFLGVDHGWGEGAPILFETMVFNDYGDDGQLNRYATWAEAELGHMEMVEALQAKLGIKTEAGS